MRKYFLVIDEGTTGTRAVITDTDFRVKSYSYLPIKQYTPRPGYVEHDFNELYEKSVQACRSALTRAGLRPEDMISIGISNQRNTVCVWSRSTGVPLCPGIVWQDTRTGELLARERQKAYVRDNEVTRCGRAFVTSSGVIVLKWLMEAYPAVAEAMEKKDLLYGSVETWLIWKLTGGRTHAMTYSNASSLGIYDFITEGWCHTVFEGAGVSMDILPRLYPEAGDFGHTEVFGASIPITGAIGDQQASMFMQNCRREGQAKSTNGTGTFFDINIGHTYKEPIPGLATMVAWEIGGQKTYLYEGMLPAAGAAVSWLKDGLGLIGDPKETCNLAVSVPDSRGVVFVCTLAGAFVPNYDPYARGAIFGIEPGVTKAHFVRALLEGIAFGFADIIQVLSIRRGIVLESVCIDGGVSQNDFVAQCFSDFVGCDVYRSRVSENITALGAAQIASIGAGVITESQISGQKDGYDVFRPRIDGEERFERLRRYREAVRRSGGWANV